MVRNASKRGVDPWKRDVGDALIEPFKIDILKYALPLGSYRLYLAVTPAEDRGRYYIWETSFDLLDSVRSRSSLKVFGSCEDLVRGIKDSAIREMEINIDTLIAAAKQGQWGCWTPSEFSPGPTPAPPLPVTGEASQYSVTNVQVAGVDEADFLKNDGGYIYILADGRFQIVNAWPPQDGRVISSVAVEGEPKKLFVANGRALVYSSLAPVEASDF